MKKVLFLLVLSLVNCKKDVKSANLSAQPASQVVDSTPAPTPTPILISTIMDTATAYIKALDYIDGAAFGSYTLHSVVGAEPSVNTDYLDYISDIGGGTKGLYAQGPNASLNGNAFTLFMTVTFDATTAGNYSYLFATDSSAPGPTFDIHMENADATTVMMVIESNDGNDGHYYSHWVYVPMSTFDHKVVITIVADKMLDYSAANIRHFKTYFNGVEIDDAINSSWAQTTTAVAPFLDNQKIYIGYTPSSSAGAVGVSGKVYNFGIFDKALTPTEVTELTQLQQ